MNDKDYIFKKGKTEEEKINNLKEISNLLSQKLDMNLTYIDYDSLIKNKDKESAKSLLVLFINILKVNEQNKQKKDNLHFNNDQKKDNLHFNNDIELMKRSVLTERDDKENLLKNNQSINIPLINKMVDNNNELIKKSNTTKNKFDKFLMNIANKIDLNLNKVSRPYSTGKKSARKTDLKILYIPLGKRSGPQLKNYNIFDMINRAKGKEKEKFKSKKKNNFHIYLTNQELIYEVVKIIKNAIPGEDFYNFLVNLSFTQKMLNIIEKIYSIHFLRHKSIDISKHFLSDHIMDIITIIKVELGLFNTKSNKSKNKSNKSHSKKNLANRNIKELSKLFKDILWLRKFHNFNCIRIGHEIKESKINYEHIRKKSDENINNFKKLFLKLISVEECNCKEDKEFQKFLMNIKYYQILETKADILKYLRKKNNEVKFLKKYNLLI